MFYMAYGMNTNREQMRLRCPNAKPLGGFYLPDTRLIFRGVADIRKDIDCILPVVLWEITQHCLNSLDKLEGYPRLYNRYKINGDWIMYDMNGDKNSLGAPSDYYYNMIEQGYKDFGLDDYNLRSAYEDASYFAQSGTTKGKLVNA